VTAKGVSAREPERPAAVQDLFEGRAIADGAPVAPMTRRPAAPETETRREISFGRLGSGVACAGAAGIILRFPVWMLGGFLCAAVLGELVAGWRWVSRLYWAALASAISAQATSLFVSPFNWPLRFGFFFVLLFAIVLFYGSQTKDLS
jgi:hypothetical protein